MIPRLSGPWPSYYTDKTVTALKWTFSMHKETWYSKEWGTLLVAQLVEALRYKPETRGFDSRWRYWNFSLTQSFRPHYCPGVD